MAVHTSFKGDHAGRARITGIFGVLGGVCAGLVVLVPPLLGAAALSGVPQYAACVIAMYAAHGATRAATAVAPRPTFAGQLAPGAAAGVIAALLTALSRYALAAWLAPGAFATECRAAAARFAASGRAGAVGLERAYDACIDPARQAFALAVTVLFFALLAGLYGVWRLRRALKPRAPSAGDAIR